MNKTLPLALTAFLLAGCTGSTKFADVNSLAPLPPELKAPCTSPVKIPERPLNDQEIEEYWGKDRFSLAACRAKHKRVVELY
jgi:hypothetical protein